MSCEHSILYLLADLWLLLGYKCVNYWTLPAFTFSSCSTRENFHSSHIHPFIQNRLRQMESGVPLDGNVWDFMVKAQECNFYI